MVAGRVDRWDELLRWFAREPAREEHRPVRFAVEGNDITSIKMTGGAFDATTVLALSSIGTIQADQFRNSTLWTRPAGNSQFHHGQRQYQHHPDHHARRRYVGPAHRRGRIDHREHRRSQHHP